MRGADCWFDLSDGPQYSTLLSKAQLLRREVGEEDQRRKLYDSTQDSLTPVDVTTQGYDVD